MRIAIHRILFAGLLLVGCLLLQPCIEAQQTGKTDDRANLSSIVDEVVEQQIEQQQLVGCCVGVIQDGKVACLRSYGFEDRENKIATSTDTMYRWASVSKPVTAVAALQLVQQGKLSLDDDVRKWVSEFPEQEHVIRVRDLMCHQSGIVHYSNGKVVRTKREYDSPHPFESVILALDRFKESPLVHPPGEQVSYSTHAYILLSAVVERAGQKKFIEQVNERICQPLDMQTLQPDYQWIEIPNRAVGYYKGRLRNEIRKSTNTDVSWKLGGGGFISSVDDMAAFAAGLLGNELLDDETRKTMWTAQKLADGNQTQVGLGVFLSRPNAEQTTISHNGSQEKTRTRLVIWPEQNFGVVVMSNSQYAEPGRITTAIYNAVHASK